jgi:hypothetical protein
MVSWKSWNGDANEDDDRTNRRCNQTLKAMKSFANE